MESLIIEKDSIISIGVYNQGEATIKKVIIRCEQNNIAESEKKKKIESTIK